MANEFVAKNGLISQNNSTVSGSLTVTQGITGSLQGTASWAQNAVTASYITSSNIVGTVASASYAATASFALNSSAGGSPFYYQTTAPATGSSPITGSMWVNSNTGIEYNLIYDGSKYVWLQQTLPIGPSGPQGANGLNLLDTSTSTTFNGILKGNGVNVTTTTVTESLGYVPENVANKSTDGTFAANSDALYPSQRAIRTFVNNNSNISDDTDYAMIMQQRYFFNF